MAPGKKSKGKKAKQVITQLGGGAVTTEFEIEGYGEHSQAERTATNVPLTPVPPPAPTARRSRRAAAMAVPLPALATPAPPVLPTSRPVEPVATPAPQPTRRGRPVEIEVIDEPEVPTPKNANAPWLIPGLPPRPSTLHNDPPSSSTPPHDAPPSSRRRTHQPPPPLPVRPEYVDDLFTESNCLPATPVCPRAPLGAALASGEQFDTPSPCSSSATPASRRCPGVLPPRSRGTPRAGRHSPLPHHGRRSAAKKAKGRPEADDVWKFYEEIDEHHCCRFCRVESKGGTRKRPARYATSTSTGVLRKHLIRHHADPWIAACDKYEIPITADAAQPALRQYREDRGQPRPPGDEEVRQTYSKEAFVDAICAWIAGDDQSLNVIENPLLRNIFLLLRQELKDEDIPGRTKVRERVMELWEEHISHLSKEIEENALGRVSFTTDVWTDQSLNAYMGVTAHWIEGSENKLSYRPKFNLAMRTELIGFYHLPGQHTGEHLAHAFLHVLDRLGLADRIGWISVDNASNNNTMMEWLQKLLRRRGIVFDRVKQHIRCFAHIVNLACKSVIAAITNMKYADPEAAPYVPPSTTSSTTPTFLGALTRDPIAMIRAIISLIRASSERREQFSKCVKAILAGKDLKLLRDMEVRWSSTLLMVERALELRDAIDDFLDKRHPEHELEEDEWEALEVVRKILAVPHAFQQKLSQESVPTLNGTIPVFGAMENSWERLKADETIPADAIDVIDAGLSKLKTYRERIETVPVYYLAILLDPKKKIQWFYKHAPGEAASAKSLFYTTLKAYRTTATPARPKPRNNWADDVLQMDDDDLTDVPQVTSLSDEIKVYFDEVVRGSGGLIYWQDAQHRFPTIFKLAMDILPVPATSVPCERIFSSAKETDTLRRNRKGTDLMEALQMLKFAVTRSQGAALHFGKGTSKEDESAALEQWLEQQTHVPQDIHGYLESFTTQK